MHKKTKEGLMKLHQEILDNKYRFETRFPSENALMRHLHLGRGAVRAILNQLREENLISASSQGKTSKSLYRCVSQIYKAKLLFLTKDETLFFNDVIYDPQYFGILQRCSELGYQLDILYVNDEEEICRSIVDYVIEKGYAGVVTTIYPFEQCIQKLVSCKIPCVIGGYEEGDSLPCSQMNFRRIGHLAGRWLWKFHRKNIAVLAGNLDTFLYREMLAGFRGALAEEKYYLPDKNILTLECQGTMTQKMYQNVHDFLYDRNPDGIFTMRDYRACFAYGFAMKYNIKIPENLSIISFDNHSWRASSIVGLTTIEEPSRQLGIEAIDFIHEWIATRKQPMNRIVNGKLIDRIS